MPDNFVLPEDRVHQDNSLKTVDETKLDNDIKELKQMINDVGRDDSFAVLFLSIVIRP